MAVIFLQSVNWLVSVIEEECVHCAVRTPSVNLSVGTVGKMYVPATINRIYVFMQSDLDI